MYRVERNADEVLILGPDNYRKVLLKSDVAITLRENIADDWGGPLSPYAVQIGKMTDAELVACALGINSDERSLIDHDQLE